MEAALLTPEQTAPAQVRRPKAWWLEPLEPYARPDLMRSLGCLATSVVPYVALWVAMYFSLRVSYLLTLALAFPAAGFLVRTFIVFHDCGHGSFMPSKRLNRIVGVRHRIARVQRVLRLDARSRRAPCDLRRPR